MVLIVGLRRLNPKIPGVLVVVVLSIIAASVLDLGERGVSLVGGDATGLPAVHLPRRLGVADLPLLLIGARGHHGGLAGRHHLDGVARSPHAAGRPVDGNREMIGIGAANVAAGFFQGFPVSTSGSRTAVAAQAGAKTQVTGLVGAAAITLILLLAPGLLRNLPQPTLAAVVIAASLSLADINGTVPAVPAAAGPSSCCRWPPSSASCCSACLPGIADRGRALDRQRVPPGVVAVPGRPGPGVRGCRAITTSAVTRTRTRAGRMLAIYRFDAPLFFAERAYTFREQVRALADAEPRAAVDPRRGRADHRRRHHRGRHAARTSTRSSTRRASTWCSPS